MLVVSQVVPLMACLTGRPGSRRVFSRPKTCRGTAYWHRFCALRNVSHEGRLMTCPNNLDLFGELMRQRLARTSPPVTTADKPCMKFRLSQVQGDSAWIPSPAACALLGG